MTDTYQAHAPAIHCDGCAQSIKRSLGRLSGVQSVQVNVESKDVEILYDAQAVTESAIRDRLAAVGFPVEQVSQR